MPAAQQKAVDALVETLATAATALAEKSKPLTEATATHTEKKAAYDKCKEDK